MNENKKQRLSAQAEIQLAQQAVPPLPSDADGQELLHNLQVHQIELEMQNETLREAQAALEDSRDRYLDLYEFSPLGYLTLNSDCLVLEGNLTAVAMLGVERRVLIHSRFLALVTPEDQPRWMSAFMHIKKLGGKGSLEVTMQRHDGTRFQAQLDCERRGNPSEGQDGTIIKEVQLAPSGRVLGFPTADQGGTTMRVILKDITAHKQSEAQLKQAASVFSHAHEGIIITKTTGEILDVNGAFTLITGYPREEVLGRNPRFLSSGQHDRAFYAALWSKLTSEGHWSGEIWNKRKNGDIYAELLTISAVSDEQGSVNHYVGLFFDITAQKEYEHSLERLAHYDILTGLPNRGLLTNLLRENMEQAERLNTRLAVAYLDLDGFKAINDRHGHDVGDQLLIALAEGMKASLRKSDTLARLGGDEFLAVLTDFGDSEASELPLARLLASVAQPVSVGELVLQASASIGVTFYPQDNVDSDQLLRQAAHSMYQAKLAGKSRYHFFNAEQDLSVRTYHETLATVRHALSTQALVLHYQPKVNMRTGAVVGVEALIRWQHPEMGLLPPSAFLPLIEGQPLAIEVGEWVMATALEQMEQWKTGGLDMPVSINIGASQIQQASFVEHLAAILRAHPSIPPAALAFEILETTALEDWESVSAVIKNCETLGIRFALDDFGTGYSSLTYLKRLPVASLKIDQTFVHDMRSDPDNLAILVAIIGLANSLHRQIIAEGVESAEQGEMLLQLGCELAQGYFIARPMPAAELPAWVDAWHTDPIWKNRTALGPDHLSLLFASAELRAWIAAVASSLDGKSEAPPAVDSVLCRFGVWLDTVGLARYGDLPAFRVIEPLHRAVHALALELLHSHSHDQEAERAAQRDKLIQLGESLLTHLKNLAEAPSPPQAPIEAEPCLSAKNPAPG